MPVFRLFHTTPDELLSAPQMQPGWRRLAKASLLTLIPALAACASPVLTFRVIEGNLRGGGNVFDSVIPYKEPYQIVDSLTGRRVGDNISRIIIKNNENYTDVLRDKIISIGGECAMNGISYKCTISRYLKSEECFNQKCGTSTKRWVVYVNWVDREGPIQPKVDISMTVEKSK